MENRKFIRAAIKNFSVEIADGFGFFTGNVSDISRFGLCITDLSSHLSELVRTMTVLVTGQGMRFVMNVRPRWTAKKELGPNEFMGIEILNPPSDWTEFVMSFEPKAPDEWATITL